MASLKILLIFAIAWGVHFQNPRIQHVVVIGKALNAKAGAMVISEKQGGFYIDGLSAWDQKFYGKKVRVTGTEVVENMQVDTAGPLAQMIKGPKRMIKNAKWEVLK